MGDTDPISGQIDEQSGCAGQLVPPVVAGAPASSSSVPGRPRHRVLRAVAVLAAVLVVGSVGGAVGAHVATSRAETGFSDVPPGHPFASEIAWMADNGIAGGFADGTFRPADPVSRQAFAAFLARYAGNGEWVTNGLLGEVKSGTMIEAIATCPPATMPMTGGAGASSHVVLNTSTPLLTGPTRGWRAEWRTPSGVATTAFVQVWAFCVPVAP